MAYWQPLIYIFLTDWNFLFWCRLDLSLVLSAMSWNPTLSALSMDWQVFEKNYECWFAKPLVRFQPNPLTLDSCQLGNPTNFLYINLFLFQGVFILLTGFQSRETKEMLSRFFTRVKFDLVQSSRQKREILKALWFSPKSWSIHHLNKRRLPWKFCGNKHIKFC